MSKCVGFEDNNGGAPAMPVQGIREDDSSLKLYGQLFHGMTKREAFAMAAMQGLCTRGTNNMAYRYYAESAVKHADALLKALEEK